MSVSARAGHNALVPALRRLSAGAVAFGVLAPATAHAQGAAPAEGTSWLGWAAYFIVLAVVALVCAAYAKGARMDGESRPAAHVMFGAGMAALLVALELPISVMADHLFWMQQAQTTLLRMVGPMLIMLAAPAAPLLRAIGRTPAEPRSEMLFPDEAPPPHPLMAILGHPAVATFLFIAVFAAWQIPAWLGAAVHNGAVAALMRVSLLATALLFWWRALDPRSPPDGPGYAARLAMLLFATLTQIGLGAYLTVKSDVLYPAYDAVGQLHHTAALNDETIGGAIIWVPGSIICVLAAIAIIHLWGKHETRVDLKRTASSGSNSAAMLYPTTGNALIENARPKNRIMALGAAAFAIAMFAFIIISGVLNHLDHAHAHPSAVPQLSQP